MPSPPTIEFRANDRVVVAGDSLTANGWFWPLAASIHNALAPRQVRTYIGHAAMLSAYGNTPAVSPGLAPQPNAGMVWINSGVAGDDIGPIGAVGGSVGADVPGRITAHSPTVVIIFAGINDEQHFASTGHPTESESATNLTNLLTASKAANPSARHLYIAPLCWGENWSAGTPPVGNNAHDTSLDSRIAALTTVCASQNVCMINPRPQLWPWEAANNPDHLNCTFGGRTLLTTDFIHLTPDVGAPWLSARVFERVVLG